MVSNRLRQPLFVFGFSGPPYQSPTHANFLKVAVRFRPSVLPELLSTTLFQPFTTWNPPTQLFTHRPRGAQAEVVIRNRPGK